MDADVYATGAGASTGADHGIVTRVKFFYANGTAWGINVLEIGLRVDMKTGQVYVGPNQQPESKSSALVLGNNGRSASWSGGPQNDPFPVLLDPDRFDAVRINYPASAFPMSSSMDYGIAQVIAGIKALPSGQPFALGGFSQGAALMSSVYNEIRYGTLTSRASTFVGGVMFGNPRRQKNHRGSVGGTWTGAWDVPNSIIDGHGNFPTSGSYARLTNCEPKWIEFTYPGDIMSSTGDTTTGLNWTAATNVLLTLDVGQIITYFLTGMAAPIVSATNAAFAQGAIMLSMLDGKGTTVNLAGSGHVAYPFLPPYGLTGPTAYQVAMTYLEGLADSYATAPILAPPASAGWSRTLTLPPA